ncbi:hypothetical protein SAMN03159496_05871 [Rhizobium sp. NFR07]|nr:hypothetical protein SAMN03159496_05871 [Rhizobium sp. NFR07]
MTRNITVAMAFALTSARRHAAEHTKGDKKTAKGEPLRLPGVAANIVLGDWGKSPGKQTGQFQL